MISFENDYNNGAHPKILEALIKYNEVRTTPYGYDEFTEQAKKNIMEACSDTDAQIYFLAGGTQTNATVIDSLLYQYEGVIAVETGHINVHEAGAIEFTEHKILTIPGKLGKMEAHALDAFLNAFMHDGNNTHCVYPGLVYITFPTELGTLYSAQELDDIYSVCKHYNLPLYIDGARLGYGLMSPESDIDLPYLAHHCDVFYIGGTKVGALCGEAVVFTHHNAHKHFFSIQKQHGAVMAKGRLNGVQFMTLFTDNLYFNIARHAIDMAMEMKEIFKTNGYDFFIDSATNQQFVIIDNAEVERLQQRLEFTHWSQYDNDRMVCRFVTSWATTQAEIDELRQIIST